MTRKKNPPEMQELLSPPEAETLGSASAEADGLSTTDDAAPDWEAIAADIEDEAAADTGEDADAAGMSREEADRLRKEIFYSALGVSLQVPNFARKLKRQPTLRSLDLAEYGDAGRAASDQLHDRLMEITWFDQVFGPIEQFMARYGAIFALGFVMTDSLKKELAAQAEAERKAKEDAEGHDMGRPAAEEAA